MKIETVVDSVPTYLQRKKHLLNRVILFLDNTQSSMKVIKFDTATWVPAFPKGLSLIGPINVFDSEKSLSNK